MDDEGWPGPNDGGHAKPERLVAEFRIHGTLCMAVREDQMTDALELWGGGDSESQAATKVIGNCAIAGRRYLILASPDGGEAPGETENAVADMLTRRELQVALMVCEGRGNKQIAHRLRLSEWTVASYLRRAYTKLGVRTRAAMVARVMTEMAGKSRYDA